MLATGSLIACLRVPLHDCWDVRNAFVRGFVGEIAGCFLIPVRFVFDYKGRCFLLVYARACGLRHRFYQCRRPVARLLLVIVVSTAEMRSRSNLEWRNFRARLGVVGEHLAKLCRVKLPLHIENLNKFLVVPHSSDCQYVDWPDASEGCAESNHRHSRCV